MQDFLAQLQRWRVASGEMRALLQSKDELLDRRAELLRTNVLEFRSLVSAAREFADRADEGDQSPEARSTSLRNR